MAVGKSLSGSSKDIENDLNSEKESKRPGNSAFKQQRLKAWQPILTASSVLPVFFFIGIVFLPIGIGLLVTSNKIQEFEKDYTDCNSCTKFFDNQTNFGKTCDCTVKFSLSSKFSGQVYMYYGLSNFYQNHRRYVRSRDDSQLHGVLKSAVSSNCKPYDKRSVIVNNKTVQQTIAPCGAIANSLFNDTFKLYYMTNSTARQPVSLSYKNIAWKSDRTKKFRNPTGGKSLADAFSGYAKPKNWQKNVWELDTGDASNNGFVNQDFIVWMRVAAFPTFKKLYRIVGDSSGLKAGDYEVVISYNYPVHQFKGKKRFILSTASWIGGKNPFLGIAYIVVGSLCIVFGLIFLAVHYKVRTRSLREWSRR